MMILSGQPISASQRVITDPSNSGVPSAWSSVLFRASRIRTEFTHTTSSAGLVFSAAPFTTRQVVEEDAADSITVGSGISQEFDEVVADAVSILGFAQAGLIEDVLEAVQAKSTAGSTRASSGVLADYLRSSDLIARAMDAALGDVMAIAGSVLARNRATYTVQDHVTILAAAASVLYAVADVSVTVLAQDYNAAVAEETLDAQAACISAADTWLLAASTIIENIQVAASADPAYMQSFVQDGLFWHLLTYCAGVGGSLLIIGSAAGVVAMGLEKINFGWYFKKITLLAFAGYASGILVILLEHLLVGL